jgi:transcriptional regulator with XRE-family HTH domain
MSDLLKLVGEQLRTIRKAKNLTQEDIADKSGLSFSYISDVERGTRNISLESLEKIIVALGVMPYEVFSFKNIETELDLSDKRLIVEVIGSLLMDRSIEEVKFIQKVVTEYIITSKKLKPH